MTILLIILGLICILAGLVGCIIPAVPGPPLSYVGLLLLHFTKDYELSMPMLLIVLALVVLVTVLDFVIPMWGSKYFGATKWGTRGSLVGTILGLFFLPWGIIIGPFLGAFVGEMLQKRDAAQAVKSGLGSVIGFLVGTVFKCALSGYMAWVFFSEIIGRIISDIL